MDEALDSDLLQAARNGQQEAFTDLYRRHVDAARREARRRCRTSSAADDAVASAFASVFRRVMNGAGPSDHFRAYLLTAVRNAVIDQSRRRDVDSAPLPDAELPDESESVSDREPLAASLGAAFLTLPERQRDALWKTEVEGRTNPEMAALFDLSENAFAALKKRARQNLCVAYERELIGGDDLCTWIADRVSAIVVGEIGYSRRLLVDLHVDRCDACAALLPERDRTKAPMLGLPLLLAAPAIRRLRGPVPKWWTGATGAQHAAALVAVVAGAAAVVALVLGGGEPQRSMSPEISTTGGTVLGGTPVIDESAGEELIGVVALRSADSPDLSDGDRPPDVAVPDREHQRISNVGNALDDTVTEPTDPPAPAPASDTDADADADDGPASAEPVQAAGDSTANEPAAPPPTAPTDDPSTTLSSDDSPTTTVPQPTETIAPTTTTVPPLIGTIAATTTTAPPLIGAIAATTTTAPPLIGTIPTTTTTVLLIGTIATTTTTQPLIGMISP